jgi:hypothetical protein
MLINYNFIALDALQRFQEFIELVRHNYGHEYLIPNDRGRFLNAHGNEVTLLMEPQ